MKIQNKKLISTRKSSTLPSSGSNSGRVCFDRINKDVYYPFGTRNKIYRVNEDLTSAFNVYDVPSGDPLLAGGIDVHPWNKHIYFTAFLPTTFKDFYLQRIDYDGTNLTTLQFHSTGADALGSSTSCVCVTQQEEYVFYSETWGSGGSSHAQLRRCNADGSNDILIWDGVGIGSPFVMRVDNENKILYWTIGNRYVYKSDYLGTAPTVILDIMASVPPLPDRTGRNYGMRLIGWDAIDDLLHFSLYLPGVTGTTAPGMGIWSMNANGGDIKPIVVYPNTIDTATNLASWYMLGDILTIFGCGHRST